MNNNMASIEILTGPMFSGKTEGLIKRVLRAKANGQRAQVFYPKLDTRQDNQSNIFRIHSHGGMTLEATPIDNPDDILHLLEDGTLVVAVDEIQFFDRAIIRVCNSLVDKGKVVIVAGLDRDFRGEPFETVSELINRVKVNRLRSRCTICNSPADFTQRIINGVPAPYTSPLIMIGGSELYEPRCKTHYSVPGRPRKQEESNSNNVTSPLEDLPGIVDATYQLDQWIDRLQAIARTGLGYVVTANVPERYFDQERYEDLLRLAAEMKAYIHDHQTQLDRLSLDEFYRDWRSQVQPGQPSYITPKSTSFGAIFNCQNELLLIRRKESPYWDLPGGWCDIGYSAAENAVKEIYEETGLWTKPINLIGIYDSRRWGFLSSTQLYALVFYCEISSGELHSHPVEIAEISNFTESELPSLLPGVESSIHHAFAFHRGGRKEVYFDLRTSWNI